jgi:signal recognition particle subunit SRP72
MSAPDLATLLRKTHLDSHEDLLKAANSTLKKSKTDITAQQVRAIALLKQDRYEDAVRAFEEAGDALKERATLAYAYGLYKAGELKKSEEVATRAGSGERGVSHVLAQTKYRLEKFDDAAHIYTQLAEPSSDASAEESDLRINSSAVGVQLQWKGLGHLVQKKKATREDLEAFESAYNAACASIARGELGQGEVLLRRAKDLCSASEDLPEEVKTAEMLPITVQQIYVLTRQGRHDDAAKLYESLDTSDMSDLSTKHVATVNSLAGAKETTNPYHAHKVFHSSPQLPKNDLPFHYQLEILRQNELAIDLLSLKYPGVARSTAEFLSSQLSPTVSSSVNSISVLNAAANARGETGKAALKAILPLLEKRPADVGLLLTVIHLYLLTNNHGSAITLLEKFLLRLESSNTSSHADVRFAPGLVGTIVSLYALEGRTTQIRTELAKAAKYWRSKRKPGESTSPLPVALLRAAGTSLLESADPEDLKTAGDIFADLHAYDPSDRASTAGLIAAYATTDPTKLDSGLQDSLTDAARVVADIDAADLEEAGVARPVISPTSGVKEITKKRTADDTKPKAKRIRAGRMPKDFEEGKKVDPERWLPLRDRSYWKPKGRKGKARAAGLTQGGAVDEAKPAAEPTKTIQGGASKNKKKKAKGGKK